MDSNASNSDEAKMWERPWTVDELRHNAGNWSLAGDSGLLHHIQDFSKRLLARVHDTNTLMDDLMHESKLASVRVDDAFNDFVMLANTQFVENRVFDDDVTQEPEAEKTPEPEKSREQREVELVTRVKDAIQHGLAVVDDMFEIVHVDIGADSDSEEEEMPGESILKVKNPYLDRPLPHLFGTQAFMSDDFIGLKEESSSEESEEEEESESESEESEKKSDSDEFSDDLSEPEKREIIPRKNTQKRPPSSSESDGDLFGEKGDLFDDRSEDDEDINHIPTTGSPPKKPAGGFASELAKRIGAAPPAGVGENSESEDDWDEQAKHKSREAKTIKPASSQPHHHESKTKHKDTKSKTTKKRVEEDEDDLFPPEDDGETSWVAGGGGGGLFSGGGLFDEPGGGLFDDILDGAAQEKTVEKAAPKVNKKSELSPTGKHKPPGGVSIFGPGDDDLFGESPPEAPPTKAPPRKAAPPIGADLFLGEDDSEDDLFATKPKVKETKPTKAPPVVDLFVDEADGEGDLFAVAKPKPTPPSAEKKKPSLAGAVPMFGGGVNPLTLAAASRRPKSEDEASDDNRSTSSSKTSSRVAGKQERSPSLSSNSNSLFADEPEELPTSNKKAPKPPVAAIFDDDADDDNDLFSTAPESGSQSRKPRATSLFIEDEDDDDLFAATSKPKPGTKEEPSKENKPAGRPTKPLFSPVEGGGDLFGGVQKEKGASTQPKAEPAKKKVAISLFDDDDDMGDEAGSDLFAPAATKAVNGKSPASSTQVSSKAAAKPRKSLFADDDVLFASTDDDPNIDLFGPTSPLTPKQPPTFPAPVFETASAPSLTVDPPSKPTSLPPLPLDGATTTESDDVTPVNHPDVVDAKKMASPSRSKPIGGVSLFGGVDVMSSIKAKRSSMFHEEEETPEATTNHVDTGHVDVGHVKTSHVVTSHVVPVVKAGVEEGAVSFEEPVIADPLPSLNKGRAKIGAKRRPPTRRGRQTPGEDAPPEPVVQVKRPTLLEIAGTTPTTIVSVPALQDKRVPPIDNDLNDSPDELFQTPKMESKSRPAEPLRRDVPDLVSSSITNGSSVGSVSSAFTKPTKTVTLDNADLDSPDDLFAKKPVKKPHHVDIFGSPDGGEHKDIFSSQPRPSRTLKLDHEAEDVFGDLDGANDTKKSKLPSSNVFDDSPTDIFNSPKLVPPPSGGDEIFSTPSAKISSRAPGRDSGRSDSDEDIFKTTETKTGSKAKDPFEEDEEDIFMTPVRTPAPPVTSSRTDVDADDIFKDDTDIFADIPKKTKKSRKDGSLFNDDVDDIFATPSAKTPNKKTTPTNKKTKTKKKTKQSSQQAAASIFDEKAPSIFDDPLSALQS